MISKFNKRLTLLCVIDIYRKYAWVIPLNEKEGITIYNAFKKISNESNHKPNKIWVDKGSEFYKKMMKLFLRNNEIEMYAMHNEGESVIAERFIRILKNIYKYMIWVSKNKKINKLDDIVDKYNNTYHNTTKMNPVNVKSSIYLNSSKEINYKDPKFTIGDIVRISKYKNTFE